MKNNLSYYSHETNAHNHWKFKTLRKKYGWEGEGKFWALNNMIAECDGCVLDLDIKNKINAISADLEMSVNEFIDFVDFLVKDVQLIDKKNNKISTEKTQENLVEVNARRKYQRERLGKKSLEENDNSIIENDNSIIEINVSSVEKQQSKVKESKVKESKEKQSKKNGSYFHADFVFDWKSEKEQFLAQSVWKETYLMNTKGYTEQRFDVRQKEFISFIESGNDLKSCKELQKHFRNWNVKDVEKSLQKASTARFI